MTHGSMALSCVPGLSLVRPPPEQEHEHGAQGHGHGPHGKGEPAERRVRASRQSGLLCVRRWSPELLPRLVLIASVALQHSAAGCKVSAYAPCGPCAGGRAHGGKHAPPPPPPPTVPGVVAWRGAHWELSNSGTTSLGASGAAAWGCGAQRPSLPATGRGWRCGHLK
jgi:hypothetical protein